MRQVVIENPVINSPFKEPQRHFKFDEQGITNEIVSKRRNSASLLSDLRLFLKSPLSSAGPA
ncbi:MAG: hypothetical protein ACE1ZS_11670, partial [Candidatus Poribacteria bacterium]